MKPFLILFFTVFCLLFMPVSAFAQEDAVDEMQESESLIVHCGEPVESSVKTEASIPVCDIYTRQLAYRENILAFRDQLRERQANFAAPSLEARRNYDKMIEELHDGIDPADF